jgi:hypothetical protein
MAVQRLRSLQDNLRRERGELATLAADMRRMRNPGAPDVARAAERLDQAVGFLDMASRFQLEAPADNPRPVSSQGGRSEFTRRSRDF